MSDTQWWERLRLGHMLSLVFLILAGCGGSHEPGGSTTAVGRSQLILHVTTADQQRAGLRPRAVTPAQTRQGEPITRLRVEVSGPGIPLPIVVECPLSGPVTPQCQVTETPDAFIVTIALLVPVGTERLVVVTALDQTGTEILRGMGTVDLTQPVQTFTVMLTPVQSNTPPRADAGPDQTVAVGTTVMLLGNGSSDADGDPLTFAWELLVRPPGSQATLSNPTSLNPTFVVDRPGTYMVQLTVNDGQVDSQPDVVTIDTVNSIPVANAGSNQLLVSTGQIVQLDGSGSSDPNGDSLTFRWALTTRPAGSQATLTNATLVNPTFVADVLGTYVAQLIVNDGRLDSVPATVTISAGNLPPVANAGLDQAVVVRQTVQLDGSGSSDPNGDSLTFRWALTTRPAGSQATLTNATLVNPTFVADVLGTYVAQLIVNDGLLDSPPATVTISAGNLPPVANAGLDQAVVVRQTVQLDGSGSSDPNGDSLTFRWALTTRPAGSQATLTNATLVNPTFVADVLGTYVAQLIVNDGRLDSVPATVTISAGNLPPVANAGLDQAVVVRQTVQLDGSGSSDPNGDSLTFRWALTTRPAGSQATLTNATLVNPTFVADVLGTYVAQLIVNDGRLDSVPATVTISAGNLPPVANAGLDQAVVVRQTVQLDGSGSSDPNGDSLTFRWALTTRPAGSQATLTNATLVNPTFVADVLGTYVAQLIVNDGLLDSPPATVTISAGNLPPVANAGLDQAVVVRQTVQLDGSGSSDPNGDSLTFRWALTTRPAGSQATLTNATLVNPTFVADVPGTYVAQLIVNDGLLDSPPATVTITAVNPPPVANAGLDQSLVVRQLVQLDGSGSSDPNGDPLTFQWTLTRPPRSNATLANAATAHPTFQADIPGAYTVELIVNDGTTGSAPDTVTITATLPQPRFAYVANANSGSISSFKIDASTGALTPVNEFILTDTSNGTSFPSTPQEVSVHPSGSFVYAAANFFNSLVFGVTTDVETGAFLTSMPGSPFPVTGFANAVAVDPSGRFAYVVTQNEGPGDVEGFTIAPGTGVLTPIGSPFPTGISPQAIAIDPTARFAYVVNSSSNSISGFTIAPVTGVLTPIGSPFPTGISPQAIAIDPTTRFAYVTNGDPMFGSVSGFTIDAVTGALTIIASFPAGLSPGAVATEPSGQFLYVANTGDDTLLGYTINATSGALIPIANFSVETGGTPRAVAVDPSGRFAYVAYFDVETAGAINIYTINATTGALEAPSTLEDESVDGPVSIAITGF